MPFSIQAILNKKDDSRHLPDLDMCFSKTACWKIFGNMNGASPGEDSEACEPTDPKSYDSDSGLSEDNDGKPLSACKSEKDGDPVSDVPEESLQEETDHESTAIDNAKSDSEPNNATGKTLTAGIDQSTSWHSFILLNMLLFKIAHDTVHHNLAWSVKYL